MTRSRRRAAGFTLLELLVAMTVLGVLTGLLASGLSFGTRIWEREQKQLEQWAELQMVQDVIRRTLGEAWPLKAPASAGTEGAAEGIAFVGTDTSVEFVGPPPAQSLVRRHLSVWPAQSHRSRRGESGVDLAPARSRSDAAKRQAPRAPARRTTAARARRTEIAEGKEVVLVDRLANAEFSYFGGDDEDVKPRWRDRWRDPSKLPLLVRVQVTFPPGDRRRWPELVVAPAITGTIGEG